MNKGYTTKFNIGDTVYFIDEEEIEDGGYCKYCGGRLPGKKVKEIHRSTVKRFNVESNWNGTRIIEEYELSYPRCLTAEKLYETKEEAEQHLNDLDKQE